LNGTKSAPFHVFTINAPEAKAKDGQKNPIPKTAVKTAKFILRILEMLFIDILMA
jgi:hypothetical protein